MSIVWHILIVVAILAVGMVLIIASGGETPSTKRAAAQLSLDAYKVREKSGGEPPVMMVDGEMMTMRPDGHWVVVEPEE